MTSHLVRLTTLFWSIFAMQAWAADYPKVLIETNAGDILVALDDERAPLSVAQ